MISRATPPNKQCKMAVDSIIARGSDKTTDLTLILLFSSLVINNQGYIELLEYC